MRLYLVNPDNPVVSLNKVNWSRLNAYRVWKPLGLLVVAGLTPPDWDGLDPGCPARPAPGTVLFRLGSNHARLSVELQLL
jgi:hypothetical protein